MWVIEKEATMQATSTPPDEQVEPLPPDPREILEQEHFDAVVDRDSRIVLSILAAVGIVAAIAMSAAALVKSGNSTHTVTVTAPGANASAAASAATAPVQVISLKVVPGSKRGPDGKMHDAFSMTNFDVKVGQPVQLKIDNTDEGTHSITAPVAGVAIVVQPGVHTYTLVVHKAGRFEWKCIIPCDDETHGWAMDHPGYMAGYITAS